MKKFWMTAGRERDLIRFSEKSDQKDAKDYSFEEAKKKLIERHPIYKDYGDKFLNFVKNSPFQDWTQF